LIKSINKDKRALSPVIATVILISVTIVVAVSVAYWMGAIASGYTSFEQIELPSTYAQVVNATTWKITIDLRNTGSAAATLDSVFLNAVPLKDYSSGWALNYTGHSGLIPTYSSLGISIPNGETVTLYLYIANTVDGCSAGTNIDLKMHTAAGKDYPTRVKLP
jgi:flagellin-like protein